MQPPNFNGHDPSFVFYEDDIIALQELDANERYVPLQRVCATLGLDAEEEAQFLQTHRVLATGLQSLGSDGTGLRVDLVPLWLSQIDSQTVNAAARPRLELFQRECASVLWQAFKPQGFGAQDVLVPDRLEMEPVDHAYQGAMAQATLARQQMLIERQIEASRSSGNRVAATGDTDRPSTAFDMARAVRRVAHDLAMRSRRNEYGGVFSGLHRQFGVSSYRNLPYGRFREAMEWLERWHGDILGEPEPPPDI